MSTYGLVLAAGAGSRMGMPKVLKHDPDGTSWLGRAVSVVRAGGCDQVYVVIGAAVEDAWPLVRGLPVDLVIAANWAEGMSASLVAGLAALRETPAEAALIMLVDLPDVTSAVVNRLVADADSSTLRRASYAGRPGHPAVLGRDHWGGVIDTAVGDFGARLYLDAHEHELIECGDLATGVDVDTPVRFS